MKKLIINCLIIYKHLFSPILEVFLGKACRFQPTCSEYAQQALSKYSLGQGLRLSLKRLLSCHPLSQGGYNPLS